MDGDISGTQLAPPSSSPVGQYGRTDWRTDSPMPMSAFSHSPLAAPPPISAKPIRSEEQLTPRFVMEIKQIDEILMPLLLRIQALNAMAGGPPDRKYLHWHVETIKKWLTDNVITVAAGGKRKTHRRKIVRRRR